jgi:hypothetical protein
MGTVYLLGKEVRLRENDGCNFRVVGVVESAAESGSLENRPKGIE